MASSVVLVNGLPGAGKTTVARAVAAVLDAECFSTDVVKEALHGLPRRSVSSAVLGAAAMEAIWCMTAQLHGTVVVDSWWFAPRDRAFVTAALERVQPLHAVEIWCDVDARTARSRYARRLRDAVHEDSLRLDRDWDTWAQYAAPLALTPVVRFGTYEPLTDEGVDRLVAGLAL